MSETLEQKEKRIRLAHHLFSKLLHREKRNPYEVERELEEDLQLCEKKREEIEKIKQGIIAVNLVTNEEESKCKINLDYSKAWFKTTNNGDLIKEGEISSNQLFILLEEVINRKGEIHWTAGYILFNYWQKHTLKRGPVKQFGKVVASLNKEMGVKLLVSQTRIAGKRKTRCWILNKNIHVENFSKAKKLVEDLAKLRNKNKLEKLLEALACFPNSINTNKKLVSFLDKNREQLQNKEIIDKVLDVLDLFQKREKDLKSAIRVINSEGIDSGWKGDWAEAKKHVWHLIEEHKKINFHRIIADDLAKIAKENLPSEDRKCLNLIESINTIKNVDEAFIFKFMQEKEINECIVIAISKLKKAFGESYQKPTNAEVVSCFHQIFDKYKFNKRTIDELRKFLIEKLYREIQIDYLDQVLGIPKKKQRDFWRFLKAKKELEEENPGIHPLIDDLVEKLGSDWDRSKVDEYEWYEQNTRGYIDVETVSLYQGEYLYEKRKEDSTI